METVARLERRLDRLERYVHSPPPVAVTVTIATPKAMPIAPKGAPSVITANSMPNVLPRDTHGPIPMWPNVPMTPSVIPNTPVGPSGPAPAFVAMPEPAPAHMVHEQQWVPPRQTHIGEMANANSVVTAPGQNRQTNTPAASDPVTLCVRANGEWPDCLRDPEWRALIGLPIPATAVFSSCQCPACLPAARD